MWTKIFIRFVFVSALSGMPLLFSGCADLIQSSIDDYQNSEEVKYYEHRGVSHTNAERAAYEDQFFSKAGQQP